MISSPSTFRSCARPDATRTTQRIGLTVHRCLQHELVLRIGELRSPAEAHLNAFRWVLAKLLITVLATVVLLVHMPPISYVAGMAAVTTASSADLRPVRVQLVADAIAALFALLAATTLSVYKPRGVIRYGRRAQQDVRTVSSLMQSGRLKPGPAGSAPTTPRWVRMCGLIVLVLVALFVILHLTGRGLHGH